MRASGRSRADTSRVRLRSNVVREAAHAFYEHLGFEKSKASYAFELRKGR